MSKPVFVLLMATVILMFFITNYEPKSEIKELDADTVSIESTNNYWAFNYYEFSCYKASFEPSKIKCEIYTTNYERVDDRIEELTAVIKGEADVEIFLLSDKNTEVVMAIYENGRKVWHL